MDGLINTQTMTLTEDLEDGIRGALARMVDENWIARIWDADATLWSSDPEHGKEIRNRLGWLHLPTRIMPRIGLLREFADSVREKYDRVVLLGMGGSSLAPWCFRQIFGTVSGYPELRVLDSTVPAEILAVTDDVAPERCLFLVSSKSGTTTETCALFDYFYAQVSAATRDAGSNFAVVTDIGSPLLQTADERGVRAAFENWQDIGGRYSALSFFGMVPAALMGLPMRRMLERASGMPEACSPERRADENPGAALGALLGVCHEMGRDKVTFLTSPRITTLGDWIEQLLAESTGKQGRGLVPVVGEPLLEAEAYGDERVFVCVCMEGDNVHGELADQVAQLGHPVVRINVEEPMTIAAEMYRWEFATAVAGAIMGIDPFDQPNVQESKDKTNEVLKEYADTGELPNQHADVVEGSVLHGDVRGAVANLLDTIERGDYFAIMAYLHRTRAVDDAVQRMRVAVAAEKGVATTFGYGPRFLHSTGQLHKGGPNTGVFLQLTCSGDERVQIPGRPYDFSTLKDAQAAGDLAVLRAHGRRVVRVDLGDDVATNLNRLVDTIVEAV